MKRSGNIALLMMGVAAVAWTMTDTEEPADVAVYDSPEQCAGDGIYTEEQCQDEFATAEAEHANVAPRYNSSRDCYGDFGYNRCQRVGSGGYWIPFMMGYMLAPRSGMHTVATQPLYRSSDDPFHYRTAYNQSVNGTKGLSRVSATATKPPRMRTKTVARGGFGSRAASSGGFSFGG
jgi:uncharacterized protein YgiB involved in biofilm formation